MKTPNQCSTMVEIDELIAAIGRFDPDLEARAIAVLGSCQHSVGEPRIDAMCAALMRRAELQREVDSEVDNSRLDCCDAGSDYRIVGRVPVLIPEAAERVAADMRTVRDIFKSDL